MITSGYALNVLVIEDNPSDYFLFCEYLRLTGLSIGEVYHATRIGEAIELLHLKSPDLIFLDLTLPDSDGLDSFIRVNEHARHISIIVLSCVSDTQIALNTITMGAQDYLVN